MMSTTNTYTHADQFLVSVDCIVLGFHNKEIKLLTFSRTIEPEKGKPSLIGGFVKEHESVEDAAKRVLHGITGIENLYMEQVGAYGSVDRDPGARVISITYFALINLADFDLHSPEKFGAGWISLNQCSDLIFDHKKMVQDAIALLRQKAGAFEVGFNLLPEKFTLTQLQSLYEALYSEPLDKRNFRKKILSLEILNRLDEKDKRHSRKGAYFYTLTEDYQTKLRKENYSLSK